MSNLEGAIPGNLRCLWGAEDDLITWAEGIVASNQCLYDHLDLVETYMDCVDMVRRSNMTGDRHIALTGLFLRSFDCLSYCLRSAMSGNYAGSAMYARDLLETGFLLRYLVSEPGRPEAWLKSDPATIRQKYAPVKIRVAIDKRDGYNEQKRKKHYDALSTLGIHPTPSALLLKLDGTRNINAGPFKQAEVLTLCIEEAAFSAFLLSELVVNYCKTDLSNGANMTSRLSLRLQRTRVKYCK